MKSAILTISLMMALGCKQVKPQPQTTAIVDIYANERAYVAAHHCVLVQRIPAGRVWSSVDSRVEFKEAMNSYKCDDLTNWINILDLPPGGTD